MSSVNICYSCIRDHFLRVSSCNMEKLECRDSFSMFIHTHTHTHRKKERERRHNIRSPSVFILPNWRSNIPSRHHNFPSTTVKHYRVSLVYGPWKPGLLFSPKCRIQRPVPRSRFTDLSGYLYLVRPRSLSNLWQVKYFFIGVKTRELRETAFSERELK